MLELFCQGWSAWEMLSERCEPRFNGDSQHPSWTPSLSPPYSRFAQGGELSVC